MPGIEPTAGDQTVPADLIGFLKAFPDGLYRRGVRYLQWFLLLVAVLGILSGCRSSRDLDAFTKRHREDLNQALGVDFKRWPSDATFLYLFNQAHLQHFGKVLQDWMIRQIPGGAKGLEQLVCDGKTLRGSAIETEDGKQRFVVHPGHVVCPGARRRSGPEDLRHPRIHRAFSAQRAAEHDEARWRADPGGCVAHHAGVFRWCLEQGADILLSVKENQKILCRQIDHQFEGKRRIPFTATELETRHGRQTRWDLRAKEAPEHIKANWPGSAWIVRRQ